MDNKKIKPQLHQSHLAMLYKCGEKFRRVVLEGDREPATIPLIVGSSTHSTIARNLNHKIDNGTLLTREAVQDYSRDDFIKEWQSSPVVLNDREAFDGLEKTKGQAQDQAIKLVTAHHYDLANLINPVSVERKWVLEAPTELYDMAGTIDVDERKNLVQPDGSIKVQNNIRDTKTKKTNTGQREVDVSEQYTFYALAKFMLDGKMPDYVIQDNVIKPTKGREAYCVSYKSTRTEEDFLIVARRFAQANKIIKAGIFTPANPADWWCSKNFCGFAASGSCPYFNSKARKSVVNPMKDKGGKDDGRGKEGIIARLAATLKS